MPTILSICQNPELSEARRLLLAARGYDVLVITDIRELEKIKTVPMCAVMGTDIEPRMKRAAAGLLEQRWPGIAILEINMVRPEIKGAACVASDAPEEVLHALNDLLWPRGARYSEHLRQQARAIVERARRAVRRSEELAARIAQRTIKSRRRQRKGRHKKEEGK